MKLHNLLKNKLLFCIASALLVFLILSSLFLVGFLKASSERASDALYLEDKPFPEIVVIGIDDKSLKEIGRWPWSREVFSQTLSKLEKAKVIGVDVSFLEEENIVADSTIQSELNSMSGKVVLVSECSEFLSGQCSKWLIPIFNATHAVANIFVEHGTALAVPDKIGDQKSLSRKVAEIYLNKEIEMKERNYIEFAKYDVVSFSDVFYNRTKSDLVNGKIVLIGAVAKDLHDEQHTPIGVLPGIVIHASAVKTIITNSFLEKQSRTSVILWMFFLSLIVALVLYKFKFITSFIISLGIFVAYPIIAIFRFELGVIYNLFYPLLSIVLTFFLITGVYYIIEARQRKWISNVLGKYVSDSVAKEIMEKGEDALNLKGSKKIVTVLFADVRGFTSMSEKLQPEEVVAVLNKYLSKMTDLVFKHEGTLDKYVGDEIMATYNVPLDLENHAIKAVQTAIDMQNTARSMGTELKYGIGINTGEAIVGNIGSERRLDYTVIGDSINLGARLCGKAEPNQILISEATNNLVKDVIKTKSIGEITVKGKEKPLKVYEVVY